MTQFTPLSGPRPGPLQGQALWFVFRDRHMLTDAQGQPPLADAQAGPGPCLARVHQVGQWGGAPCLAAEAAPGAAPPQGLAWTNLYSLFMALDPALFAVCGRALQVVDWDRTHLTCPSCGLFLRPEGGEWAKRCRGCGRQFFPRVSPAVIMAVTRGEQVLLARSPRFPEGMMSTLAGFVEPGETLEQAVAREVAEEVGVTVRDVRYFGSQPWPFPDSLMVGFTARWAGGELRPDGEEVVEAGWFGRGALPKLPTGHSIARQLIDHVLGLDKG